MAKFFSFAYRFQLLELAIALVYDYYACAARFILLFAKKHGLNLHF